MGHKLDLNALVQPTLELTLRDKERTTFHIIYPSTKLVERFMAARFEVEAVRSSQDGEGIKALYELLAELISCNDEQRTVTAEELRDVYGIRFADIIFIFKAYLDFINELENAKN